MAACARLHRLGVTPCSGVTVLALLAAPAGGGALEEAAAVSPPRPAATSPDALERRVITEIGRFTRWLDRYDELGYVGEIGWPSRPRADTGRWSALADEYLAVLDREDVWVTQWATGEWWGNYRLAVYGDDREPAGLDTAEAQAAALEAHVASSDTLAGVNVSGGEFGAPPGRAATSSFSNRHPGRIGQEYHYDGRRSFEFLASRGIELVRLQFRWERIQRQPGGPLHQPELRRLRAAIARAAQAGIRVIVDLHNYGDYYLETDATADRGDRRGVRRSLGSRALPLGSLADVWARLARQLGEEPGLLGYGLMNEPVGMRARRSRSPAERWERAAQLALSAIRATGDRHLVLVQGYRWAGAQRWPRVHPDPWIRDPANRYRYEAHHYWDRHHSGGYLHSYAAEVRHARRQGF